MANEKIKDGELANIFESKSTSITTDKQKREIKEQILQTNSGKRIALFQKLKLGGVSIDDAVNMYIENASTIDKATGNIEFNQAEFAPIYALEKKKASKALGVMDIPEQFTEKEILMTINDQKMKDLVNKANIGNLNMTEVIKVIDEKNDKTAKKNIDIDYYLVKGSYEFNDELINKNTEVLEKLYNDTNYKETLNSMNDEANMIIQEKLKNKTRTVSNNPQDNSQDKDDEEPYGIDKEKYKQAIKGNEDEYGEYIGDDPLLKEIQSTLDKDNLLDAIETLEICDDVPLSQLQPDINTVLRLSKKLGYGSRFEKANGDPNLIVSEWKKIKGIIQNTKLKGALLQNLNKFEESLNNNNDPKIDQTEFGSMMYFFGNNATPKQKAKIAELMKKAIETKAFGEKTEDYDFISTAKDKDGNDQIYVDVYKKDLFVKDILSKYHYDRLHYSFLYTDDEYATFIGHKTENKHESKRYSNLSKVLRDERVDYNKPEDVDAVMIAFALSYNSEKIEKEQNKVLVTGKDVLKNSESFDIESTKIDISSTTGAILAVILENKEIFGKYIDSAGVIKADALKELMERQRDPATKNKKGIRIYADYKTDDIELQKLQEKEKPKLDSIKEKLEKLEEMEKQNPQQDEKTEDPALKKVKDELWSTVENTKYAALDYDVILALKKSDRERFDKIFGESKQFVNNDSFAKVTRSVIRNIYRFGQEIPHMITDPSTIKPNFVKIQSKLRRGAKRAFTLIKDRMNQKRLPAGINKEDGESMDEDKISELADQTITKEVSDQVSEADRTDKVPNAEVTSKATVVADKKETDKKVVVKVEEGKEKSEKELSSFDAKFKTGYTPGVNGKAIDNRTGKEIEITVQNKGDGVLKSDDKVVEENEELEEH